MDNSNFRNELRLVSMNIHGRFNGREIKQYGQLIVRHILSEKSAAMLFGQQTNFIPGLPENYEYMGGTRAFILYDKNQLHAGDEKHYKLYLRDLELQGRLPKNYLPENVFVISKMRTKNWPSMEFIAISFHTDECFGKQRSTSLFRKLSIFLDNLLEIEEMPIIVSGSFRINLEEAKQIIPPDFRCCSYLPSSRKRTMRQSNFFICTRSLMMNDVRPMVCGKMDVGDHINGSMRKYINPEDIFYWDPVAAYVHAKDQSSVWENNRPIEKHDEIRTNHMVPAKRYGLDKGEEVIQQKEVVQPATAVTNRFGFIKREKSISSSYGKKSTGALKLKPYYEALKSINVSLGQTQSPDIVKDDFSPERGEYICGDNVMNNYKMFPESIIAPGEWQESKDSLLSLSGDSQCSSDVNLSSSQDLPYTKADVDEPSDQDIEDKKANEMKRVASFIELYDEELVQNSGRRGVFTSAVPLLNKLNRVNDLLESLNEELSQSLQNIRTTTHTSDGNLDKEENSEGITAL